MWIDPIWGTKNTPGGEERGGGRGVVGSSFISQSQAPTQCWWNLEPDKEKYCWEWKCWHSKHYRRWSRRCVNTTHRKSTPKIYSPINRSKLQICLNKELLPRLWRLITIGDLCSWTFGEHDRTGCILACRHASMQGVWMCAMRCAKGYGDDAAKVWS